MFVVPLPTVLQSALEELTYLPETFLDTYFQKQSIFQCLTYRGLISLLMQPPVFRHHWERGLSHWFTVTVGSVVRIETFKRGF